MFFLLLLLKTDINKCVLIKFCRINACQILDKNIFSGFSQNIGIGNKVVLPAACLSRLIYGCQYFVSSESKDWTCQWEHCISTSLNCKRCQIILVFWMILLPPHYFSLIALILTLYCFFILLNFDSVKGGSVYVSLR